MTPLDRFAWWLAKPANCDKALAVCVGVFVAVWFMTGEWSPIP